MEDWLEEEERIRKREEVDVASVDPLDLATFSRYGLLQIPQKCTMDTVDERVASDLASGLTRSDLSFHLLRRLDRVALLEGRRMRGQSQLLRRKEERQICAHPEL